jgi:maleylpyruvate isomerase
MPRSRHDSLQWAVDGSTRFAQAVGELTPADHGTASLLPGWTRRHVVAHVAANADALSNLVHWARTGVSTPMYASPEQRAADIERGVTMSPTALRDWLVASAAALVDAWDEIGDGQWDADVVTAQGRTVPASEIPWLRAREVWVHLVDLDFGAEFADLPVPFLLALREDVLKKRGMSLEAAAPLAEQVAWLTGRPHRLTGVPTLPAWL